MMTIDPDLALFLGTDVADSDAFSVTSTSTIDHALVPEPLLFTKASHESGSRRVRRDRNGFPETSAFFDPDNVSDDEDEDEGIGSSKAKRSKSSHGTGGHGRFRHGQDADGDAADKNSLFDLPPSAWSVAPAAHSTTTSRTVSETASTTPAIKLGNGTEARAPSDKNSIFDMDFSVTPAPAPPTPSPSLVSSSSSIFTRRSNNSNPCRI
ncbi:hypothetical protein BCR44DRAFT_1230970 [Catenaria anguillulae PL171]|uniref:Uncharacterized protein n=1 Tax=Catenaria anguillulae PL171 TaxID=765915 RepID=A0A1Y2HDK8_9FUNG|nr:hypothetical protein BCR44DRAFT_1230970 [Catenaria anguillulae PL171]